MGKVKWPMAYAEGSRGYDSHVHKSRSTRHRSARIEKCEVLQSGLI